MEAFHAVLPSEAAPLPSSPSSSAGDADKAFPDSLHPLCLQPSLTVSRSQHEPHLRRLMYISQAMSPADMTSHVLEEIASKSTQRNRVVSITGFLIFASPYFVQVLEGPPGAVANLFATIAQDPRHTHCMVVLDVCPDQRNFPDWQLKMADISITTLNPLVRELLTRLVSCFASMWAYLPRDAGALLLQGRVPMEEIPRSLQLVVAFIHVSQYREMLRNECLRPQLPELLTAFADVCSTAIDASGGRVAKFINGSCMAYWPGGMASEAVVCVIDIVRKLGAVRAAHAEGASPLRLLSATAGLHRGAGLLCNAGTRKADFTLLGDCVNTAARIAGLAARLRHALLLTAEVAMAVDLAAVPPLELDGLHSVAGREHPIRCYRYCLPLPDPEALQAQIDAFGATRPSPQMTVRRTGHPAVNLPALDAFFTTEPDGEPDAQTFPLDLSPPGLVPPGPVLSPQSRRRAHHQPQASTALLQATALPQSPAADLISLTYISHMDDMDLLSEIQCAAACRNAALGISSTLMYLDGLVLQTLEGPEAVVLAMWDRIRQDPRHADAVLVAQAALPGRRCRAALAVDVVSRQAFQTFPAVRDIMAQLARSFVALETYVPATVVRQLREGCDLHTIPPRALDVVMLASDLCSFTTISEAAPLQGVWHVCTAFIDLCSAAILQQGGEVAKLIGDCVVAHFPASAAGAALEAAQAIVKGCQETRRIFRSSLDFRSLLHCGVGLDYGPVVMAHTGSHLTRDFALIGEVSVRVLELEALTRQSGRAIMASAAFVAQLSGRSRGLSKLPSAFRVGGLGVYTMLGTDWTLNPTRVRRDIAELQDADEAELEQSLTRISSALIHSTCTSRPPSLVIGPNSPRSLCRNVATADSQSPGVTLETSSRPDASPISDSPESPGSSFLAPPPSPCPSSPYSTKPRPQWVRWLCCA